MGGQNSGCPNKLKGVTSMPKRGENIRKRKDGRWEARIRTDTKNSKYISVYAKSYKEVREKKNKLLASQNLTIFNTSKLTLEDVIMQWKEEHYLHQKGSTRLKYEFIINNHILPELGTLPISKVDRLTITKFLNKKLTQGRLDKTGGLEPTYLKGIACILNSIMQFAVEQKYCDPIKISFSMPKITRKELIILGKEDQIKLETEILKNCSLTGLGILISLNFGLRIGEVCALRWDDIDLGKNCIYIRHTISRVLDDTKGKTYLTIETPKTSSSLREIPIPLKMVNIFTKMKSQARSQYVISDKEGFVSPRTYEYRFHKLLAAYEIPQVNYHALRHTFATRCIEVGVDIKTLSEFMGHSNVSITLNTYVHSSIELKRKQIEKLSTISGEMDS